MEKKEFEKKFNTGSENEIKVVEGTLYATYFLHATDFRFWSGETVALFEYGYYVACLPLRAIEGVW